MSPFSRRLRVLEALARASEATAEATRLILEDDVDPDSVPPAAPSTLFPPEEEQKEPNPLVDTLSRSMVNPRDITPLPFLVSKLPRYAAYAFTGERALAEVQKALDAAQTDGERATVLDMAERLVAQGLLSEEDVESLRNRR